MGMEGRMVSMDPPVHNSGEGHLGECIAIESETEVRNQVV